MKKQLTTLLTVFLFSSLAISQTADELKAEQAAKKDSIAAIQGRVDAIQAQLDAMPGWRIGAFGTICGSLSNFNNWYAQGAPNNSSGSIGITFNDYANLIEDNFYWRNSLTTNLNCIKLDNKDTDLDDDEFDRTTDVFNLSSLYGRNITDKLAAAALMAYRTTLLNIFNDPGYLDVGIAATWTTINTLIVVAHP